jgi:hypothetical protein
MTGFGASAPYKELDRHFGITAGIPPRRRCTGWATFKYLPSRIM